MRVKNNVERNDGVKQNNNVEEREKRSKEKLNKKSISIDVYWRKHHVTNL